MPEYVIRELAGNRTPIVGLVEKLRAGSLAVQKCTLNFPRDPDGNLHRYAETLRYLQAVLGLTVVDGGVSNLEFTVSGTSKAACLTRLAAQLDIPLNRTMADMTTDEVHKIMYICDPAQTAQVECAVKAAFPQLSVVKSSDIFLEIMADGITKATAVQTICQLWAHRPAGLLCVW